MQNAFNTHHTSLGLLLSIQGLQFFLMLRFQCITHIIRRTKSDITEIEINIILEVLLLYD